MKTLLILALVMTGCGFNGRPKVVRAGVGPDITPTPTVSRMVITEMGAMKVYVLTGVSSYSSDLLGIYKTRELAEAMEIEYGMSYNIYDIDEMEVTE